LLSGKLLPEKNAKFQLPYPTFSSQASIDTISHKTALLILMFNPEELARDTLANLEAYSDPVRADWAERNYPTGARVLGVKAGDLHKVDREISKMLAGTAPEQVINFSQVLVGLCVLECQQVAYGVLSRHKAAMPHIREKHLLSLGAQLDNWVSMDYFAGLVADPAWRERQIPDRLILDWAQSPDRW
jgi:hypothetical protein